MSIIFDNIKRRFEAERSVHGPLVSAEDFPISYEAITPTWLTKVLGRRQPEAEVVSCRLSEPDEGTSSRRRIFLTWNEAGPSCHNRRTRTLRIPRYCPLLRLG